MRPLHKYPDEGSYNPRQRNEVTMVWAWSVRFDDRRRAVHRGSAEKYPADPMPLPSHWRSAQDEDIAFHAEFGQEAAMDMRSICTLPRQIETVSCRSGFGTGGRCRTGR